MTRCANCGAEFTGKFCPNCGTAAVETAGTSASGFGAATPPLGNSINAPGLTDNMAAALCYLFGLVSGIIFLFLAPYNRNKLVRFHAFQAIFGHIAVIIGWIVLGMVSATIAIATHGHGLPLVSLYSLLVLILWLYMMYTAYTNKRVKLPLVGDLAEKQA